MRALDGLRRRLGADRFGPGARPPPHVRVGGLVVWAAFVVFPTFDALTNPGDGVRHWLAVAGTVVFSASYMWLVTLWTRPDRETLTRVIGAGLLGLALALTIGVSPKWGFLFSYVTACSALVAPSPFGFAAVMGCSLAGVGATVLGHGSGADGIGYGASALGVGLLLTLMRELRERTVELQRARAELATALYLSHGTVRNHLSAAMHKLNARNRGDAVRIAEENGWL